MRRTSNSLLTPFWDHIEELRKLLLRSFGLILLGTLLCFTFADSLIAILKPTLSVQEASGLVSYPIQIKKVSNTSNFYIYYTLTKNELLRSSSKEVVFASPSSYRIPPNGFLELERKSDLAIFSPIEGFNTVLKLSLWGGALLTAPFWLLLIWGFIAPGLEVKEKMVAIPFLGVSSLLILIGVALAIFVTIPLTNSYLFSYNSLYGQNFWGFSEYLNYVAILCLAHGIAFAITALLFFLVHFGLMAPLRLENNRKQAWIAVLILSAALTPPDVVSQIVLAIPLMLLYEAAIAYGKWRNRALT